MTPTTVVTLLLMAPVMVFVFFLSVLAAVRGADVELQCPQQWTTDGTNTLTCSIRATRFTPEVCSGQLTDVVDFVFSNKGTRGSSECTVTDFRASCENRTSSACRCKELSDGQYKLEYKISVKNKRRYEGGSWVCQVTCLDIKLQPQLSSSASDSCSGVKFDDGRHTNSARGGRSSQIFMLLMSLLSLFIVWWRRQL